MFEQIVVPPGGPVQTEQALPVATRLARVSGGTVSHTGAGCEHS
jgi:hypothetical protein